VLPEGADPDDPGVVPIETLTLDVRLFPSLEGIARLFGYRLSAHGVRGVSDQLRPGDCVVIGHDREPPAEHALVAVREGARVEIVVLGRTPRPATAVASRGGAVPSRAETVDPHPGHLRSRSGSPDSSSSVSSSTADSRRPIVGKVLLAFRRWL
jgi:hypothetical protein